MQTKMTTNVSLDYTSNNSAIVLNKLVSVLELHISTFCINFLNDSKDEKSEKEKLIPLVAHFEKVLLSEEENSHISILQQKYSLRADDLALLVFAYAWEFHPSLFKLLVANETNINLRNNFQGIQDNQRRRFIPFFHAFLVMYYGEFSEDYYNYFTDENHPLIKKNVLTFQPYSVKEECFGKLSYLVKIQEDFVRFIIGGEFPLLDSEIGFPAKLVEAKLPFNKIVLTSSTKESLEPFIRWLRVRSFLKNDQEAPFLKKIKKSQVYVFSGPPGTGKTLTATSLGETHGLKTYTLDLSRVISKYIGDFEKSMEKVFTKLEGQDAILFIDEADAIFSKRSEEVNDSKDKYANQEMSYLLQRVESFDGIVILATNVRDIRTYFDKAMLRRISEIIEFGFPLQNERLQLWQNAITDPFLYEDGLVEKLAEEFQVTGANIASAMSNILIECIDKRIEVIDKELVHKHLKNEFFKRDSRFGICRDSAPAALLMEQRLGRTSVHTGKQM